MNRKKELDLIMDALDEFGIQTCPHCEREIRWRDRLTEGDILRWLEKRELDLTSRIKELEAIEHQHKELNGVLRQEIADQAKDIESFAGSIRHWEREAQIWKKMYKKQLYGEGETCPK